MTKKANKKKYEKYCACWIPKKDKSGWAHIQVTEGKYKGVTAAESKEVIDKREAASVKRKATIAAKKTSAPASTTTAAVSKTTKTGYDKSLEPSQPHSKFGNTGDCASTAMTNYVGSKLKGDISLDPTALALDYCSRYDSNKTMQEGCMKCVKKMANYIVKNKKFPRLANTSKASSLGVAPSSKKIGDIKERIAFLAKSTEAKDIEYLKELYDEIAKGAGITAVASSSSSSSSSSPPSSTSSDPTVTTTT